MQIQVYGVLGNPLFLNPQTGFMLARNPGLAGFIFSHWSMHTKQFIRNSFNVIIVKTK